MVCIIPATFDNNIVIMGTIVGENSQDLEGLPVANEISNTEFVEAQKLPICFDIGQNCSTHCEVNVPKFVLCLGTCTTCIYLSFCSQFACMPLFCRF
jgi:hypothetical protein